MKLVGQYNFNFIWQTIIPLNLINSFHKYLYYWSYRQNYLLTNYWKCVIPLLDNMNYEAMLRIKLAMSIPLNKRMAVSIENKDSRIFFY